MGQQRNIIEEFGLHAGRVWQVLNEYGALTEENLQALTCLRTSEVHAAVGWLAREDKIAHQNNRYLLDKTNLTVNIGDNAGKVWELLHTWREVNVAHIAEYLEMDIKDLFSALGWLAREGKINISMRRRE